MIRRSFLVLNYSLLPPWSVVCNAVLDRLDSLAYSDELLDGKVI
jgi:hypothetical protein